MAEPRQKPGRSRQDVGTPRGLIEAVQRRFGPIVWDLAAHEQNHVVDFWYGPGSPWRQEALAPDARWRRRDGLLWLNPPFADIEPWAHKCSVERYYGARIALLTPASVGAVWFSRHVHRQALVLALQPRLTFVGETHPYPKDTILSVFGEPPGFDVWRWKETP